ncbi:MAG TPA: PepSY domain-containing protein [Caldilineaceae bacterium]|nr:PepSY domain-containing protein [Caldilineaceae bacterium]
MTMKMNVRQQFLSLAAVATLALGGWGTMAFIGNAQSTAQTQPAGETEDPSTDPSYSGSITIHPTLTKGLAETDESTALQGLATIDAATAAAAATDANAGTTVVKSTLEDENGYLVYSVELSNGLEVKIDAGDGTVLHSEQVGNEADGAEADGNEADGAEVNDNEQAGEQEADTEATEMNEADEGNEAADTDTIQDESGEQDEAGEQNEASEAQEAPASAVNNS